MNDSRKIMHSRTASPMTEIEARAVARKMVGATIGGMDGGWRIVRMLTVTPVIATTATSAECFWDFEFEAEPWKE